MRKILTLFAILAICLSCFAGCGDKNTSDNPTESDTPTAAAQQQSSGSEQTDSTPYAGDDTALSIGDTAFTLTECNIFFAGTYYDFLNTYGDYASMFGLDTSTGISGLKEQACDYSSDGTWFGYFMESAEMMMTQVKILTDYAKENGVTVSEETMASIEEMFAELDDVAASYGYDNGDAYLTDVFGAGVTREVYQAYVELNALADAGYEAYYNTLNFTDQELADHYAQMGYEGEENNYPVTAMRHVLIMAEQDENGEYTDAAIAAAHDRAEELYAEWLQGDKSEDSFAELANTYTEDGGSSTNGGLYEDIYKNQMVEGINNWLFAEGRAVGDTAVIDNNGSYVGTHIVYFVGQGSLYSNILAYDDLMETTISDWFTAKSEACPVVHGAAYNEIGNIG